MTDWWEDKTRVVLGSGGLLRRDVVFHLRRPWDEREIDIVEGTTTWTHRTRCGLIHSAWATNRGELKSSLPLLAEHAERIGRPCLNCFRVPQS